MTRTAVFVSEQLFNERCHRIKGVLRREGKRTDQSSKERLKNGFVDLDRFTEW